MTTEEEYIEQQFNPMLATGLALKKLCELNNVEYKENEPDSVNRTNLLIKLSNEETIGKKFDDGKNRMGLVLQGFSNALWEVGRVGTFGCTKYGEGNWQYLENGIDRYKDALFRHLFQWLQGEEIDKESGIKHLSHALWNLSAVLEFTLRQEKIESEEEDE